MRKGSIHNEKINEPSNEGGRVEKRISNKCPDCPKKEDSAVNDTHISSKNYKRYKFDGNHWKEEPFVPVIAEITRDAFSPSTPWWTSGSMVLDQQQLGTSTENVNKTNQSTPQTTLEPSTTTEPVVEVEGEYEFVDKDPLKGADNFKDYPRVRALHDDFDAKKESKRHYNRVHWDSGGITIGLAHWANSNASELIRELSGDAKVDFYNYLTDYFNENLPGDAGSNSAWVQLAEEAGVDNSIPVSSERVETAFDNTFNTDQWQKKWRKSRILPLDDDDTYLAPNDWIIHYFENNANNWHELLTMAEMQVDLPVNLENYNQAKSAVGSSSAVNEKYKNWLIGKRGFTFLKDENALSKGLKLKSVAKYQAQSFIDYQLSHETNAETYDIKSIGGIAAYSSHQNSGFKGVERPDSSYRKWKHGNKEWDWDKLPPDIEIDGTLITDEERTNEDLLQDWRAWVVWASYLKMKGKLRERNANIWYRYFAETWGPLPLDYKKYSKVHSGEHLEHGLLTEKPSETNEVSTGFDYEVFRKNTPFGVLGAEDDMSENTNLWSISSLHQLERTYKTWPYKLSKIKIYSSIKEEENKTYKSADPSGRLYLPKGAKTEEVESDGDKVKVKVTSVPSTFSTDTWVNKEFWTAKSNISNNEVTDAKASIRGQKTTYKGSGTTSEVTEFHQLLATGDTTGDWLKVKWTNYEGTEKEGWIRMINVTTKKPFN